MSSLRLSLTASSNISPKIFREKSNFNSNFRFKCNLMAERVGFEPARGYPLPPRYSETFVKRPLLPQFLYHAQHFAQSEALALSSKYSMYSFLPRRFGRSYGVVKILAFPRSKYEIIDLNLNKNEHFSKVSKFIY